MNLRSFTLITLAALVPLLAMKAHAHDPSLHADHAPPAAATAKPKPANCTQLADTKRFSSDLADPAIKALKERCDAEKKAAAKAAAAKKS